MHVLCVTVFINTLEIEGISVSDGQRHICIWLPCWISIVKSYCQVELGLNISFLQLWRLWCCYPSNTYQNEHIYHIGYFGKIKPLLEFKKVFSNPRTIFWTWITWSLQYLTLLVTPWLSKFSLDCGYFQVYIQCLSTLGPDPPFPGHVSILSSGPHVHAEDPEHGFCIPKGLMEPDMCESAGSLLGKDEHSQVPPRYPSRPFKVDID